MPSKKVYILSLFLDRNKQVLKVHQKNSTKMPVVFESPMLCNSPRADVINIYMKGTLKICNKLLKLPLSPFYRIFVVRGRRHAPTAAKAANTPANHDTDT